MGDITKGALDKKFLYRDNPFLSKLLTIKLIVSRWSINDFKALSQKGTRSTDVDITAQDLLRAKNVVIEKIDSFIKSRGYIAEEFTRFGIKHSQREILAEFNFLNALFTFATEYKYYTGFSGGLISKLKVYQSFKQIKKFYGLGEDLHLVGHLRRGGFLSSGSMETIISSVQQRFQEAFGYLYLLDDDVLLDDLMTDHESDLFDLYFTFFAEANGYAAQRGLDLFMPNEPSILNQYDKKKWDDERVKGYNVVFNLCQFLGFDPLFFKALDKSIFKNGKWARQHFRDSIFRKTSSRVSDSLLTDVWKHPTYEQFSEGFIVAIMNGLIEAIQLEKDAITRSDLESSLEKHMKKYLNDLGGTTPEGNSVGELVDKVVKIWTQDGDYKFKGQLDNLNDRRTKYISKTTGQFMYSMFLEGEYDMDANSRFVKNARDFHTLLGNDQVSGSNKGLFAAPQDYRFMRKIFPTPGSTQSRVTDWIFVFTTDSLGNINIDWINYLERQVWKI